MRTHRDEGTADSGVNRGPARPGGGPVSGARAVERRAPSRLLLPALLAAVFCVSLAGAPGGEVWRHMAAGRYLLQARSFPARDVFSFTGASWDKKEWLFDVFAYLVHRAGGARLMALVSPAFFTAAFLLLYILSVKRSGSRRLSMAVAVAAAPACWPGLAFGPASAGWLFLAVLLLMIEEFAEGKRLPLCFFPLLMLAWVNVHPFAAAGLAVLAIHLASGIVSAALPGTAERNGWRRLSPGDLCLLALILAASSLAFSCSPDSWKLFMPAAWLGAPRAASPVPIAVSPPLPVFEYPALAGFILLAVFTLVTFATAMEPSDTALMIIAGAASAASARNAPLLPLIASPAISRQFARFLGAYAPAPRPFPAAWRRAADGLIAAALLGVVAWSVRRPDFLAGGRENLLPWGAVRYIEEAKPRGRIFNTRDWGGFLIWMLYPNYRVYIDGRGPSVYPPEVQEEYGTIEGAGEGWGKALDRRGVNLILIPAGEKSRPLLDALDASNEWRLGFWDARSAVFLRDTAANRPMIEAYRYRAFDESKMALGEAVLETGPRIVSELHNYLKGSPDSIGARNLLAGIFLNRGMTDRAIAEYEAVAASHPRLPRLHYNLGMLYSRKGEVARAIAEYGKETSVAPSFPPAWNNLGRIYFEGGDFKKALDCFKKAIKSDPDYVHARNNLGLVYMEEGKAAEAIGEFKKALAIDPAYEAAARNLQIAQEMERSPAETLNRLGQGYYLRNDLAGAERQFLKAISHDPRYVVAIGNLGVVFLRQGRIEEAIRQFKKVLEIAPGDVAARRNLAAAESVMAGAGGPAGAPPPGSPYASPLPRGGER